MMDATLCSWSMAGGTVMARKVREWVENDAARLSRLPLGVRG